MSTKADVLNEVDSTLTRLSQVLKSVDEAHGTWDGAVGTWSIVHILQHLAGWLDEMTPALERMARGERPTPEGVNYSTADDWNASFIEARGIQSLADARAAFETAHAIFRCAIEGVPADRFGENKTVNRLVGAVAIEHFEEHARQIEAFLAS